MVLEIARQRKRRLRLQIVRLSDRPLDHRSRGRMRLSTTNLCMTLPIPSDIGRLPTYNYAIDLNRLTLAAMKAFVHRESDRITLSLLPLPTAVALPPALRFPAT